jgi:ABC-type antimicrobial peptide transport system permease subunit
MYIDEAYIPNLNLALIAGKNFANTKVSRHQIIVNEEFLKDFQISNPLLAIGSVVLLEDHEVEVIGVVKNFHYALLSEPIKSFIFRYDDERLQVANIKVASNNILGTLSAMDDKWRMLAGEKIFTAKFFDEEMEDAYAFYFTIVKICGFLGFLAITISCLGLLGMVVLTAENRTKEVGIRKVLGASTLGIVTMLSRDFIKLIIIATCIALPLTYLFFDLIYLRMQYYKIPIGAGEMIAGIAIILILGLITILSQTTRTARTNPVDILRCE